MLPEAVISPSKLRSSEKFIPPTSPPVDWKLLANIVPLALIFPLAVILVVTKFVILAEGADKNTSAIRVWHSIVEHDILPVVFYVNNFSFLSEVISLQ